MQQQAILLMGPTATGKTDLALKLANKYPIEIISVDSVLIYKDMNIGSAKPTRDELKRVPHYLIDIMSPLGSYSVAEFIDDAVKLIADINSRGKIPLLVGGTMMYYNALLNGISVLPPADSEVREYIENEASEFGWQAMHAKLCEIDTISSAKIKPTDKQRLSRALEVYYLTGKTITELQQLSKIHPAQNLDFLSLAIIPEERHILHERIATRFKNMLNNGLIQEVEALRGLYPELTADHTSMRSVGYYQVWQYLDKHITLDELCEQGIIATRQLAKRQITWLRSMDAININIEANLNFEKLYTNLKTAVADKLN